MKKWAGWLKDAIRLAAPSRLDNHVTKRKLADQVRGGDKAIGTRT